LEWPYELEKKIITSVNLFRILERISKLKLLPPNLTTIELGREYARFLVLKIITKDKNAENLSPSPVIDVVWHQHILDTSAYADFQKQFGVVEHNPEGVFDSAPVKSRRQQETLEVYKNVFGSPMQSQIWEMDEESADVRAPPIAHDSHANSLSQPPARKPSQPPPAKKQKASPARFVIHVKQYSGVVSDFTVSTTSTILQLKEALSVPSGVPVDQWRMLCSRNELEDDLTIGDYNITEGQFVHAFLRLKGC